MSAARISVRERISPGITASLFANYRSSADAIMELVDNSVDSRISGVALEIALTVHPTSLVVQTEGGAGMGIRELERNYLRWGASGKRGRNLLGQYGQGGKAAIGHLGARFAVEAARAEDARAWRFVDDDYRDRSHLKTYEVTEVARRVPAGTGYVRIRIDGVDKRIDVRRLPQRLADAYRPLLESGAVTISIDGVAVNPPAITALDRRAFAINAGGGRSRGWYGVSDPDAPATGWTPGFRCYKLGRLVSEGEFFGHEGPGVAPGMVRLMGEIDLPQVALTMNKSGFDRDSAAWVSVEERVHQLLKPLVKRLAKEQEVGPPESAVRMAERVRKLLAQALKVTEASHAFTGFAAAPAPRQASRDELPLEVPGGQAPERPPRVPPAGPKRDRPRSGFGIIVVRPLDPATRSTTVLEGGTRVVVINSRYPLYRERGGDMWYQLETAAREVCKLAEPANVADYERRVSELVVAATSLKRRRRPAGPRARQLDLIEAPARP